MQRAGRPSPAPGQDRCGRHRLFTGVVLGVQLLPRRVGAAFAPNPVRVEVERHPALLRRPENDILLAKLRGEDISELLRQYVLVCMYSFGSMPRVLENRYELLQTELDIEKAARTREARRRAVSDHNTCICIGYLYIL